MPVLDRQPVRAPTLPPSLQGLPPRSVPETAPTPLQKHYVLLSVPVLILGAIAITALELGAPLGSPLVKLCVRRSPRRSSSSRPPTRPSGSGDRPGHGCRSIAARGCSGSPGSPSRSSAWPRSSPRRSLVDPAHDRARFDRGPDARSTDIPSGGGVPTLARLVAELLHPLRGGLEFGAVEGEDRDRLACGSCGYVAYVNPRLVVTTIPVNDAGEVVLLRRGIEPGRGSWAQPGGFLEVDETVTEAAIRETLEETGLIVDARRDRRAVLAARGRGRRHRVRGAGRRRASTGSTRRRSTSRRSAPRRSRGTASPSRRPTGRSATGSAAATRTSTSRSAAATGRAERRR